MKLATSPQVKPILQKKPEGLAPQPTLFPHTNLVYTKLDFAKIQ